MATESVDSRPAVQGGPEPVVEVAAPELHVTSLVEQGAFAVCWCSCGWHSYARRSRPLARREGRDHALLHAATS